MKTANIWKWYLIAFQIVSIAFCILGFHSSNWWIKKHKEMTDGTTDSLQKFTNAYVSADLNRKNLLTMKTVKFVIDENNDITQANTSSNLEIQDVLEAVISFNALAMICMIFLEIKKKERNFPKSQ
jgi:hypothetical protein